MNFEGASVLVTGGSRGIGKAIAQDDDTHVARPCSLSHLVRVDFSRLHGIVVLVKEMGQAELVQNEG